MVETTRRDVLTWSAVGGGVLSIGVAGASVLPEQAREERNAMERRAAIRAFEIYEVDDNDPSTDVASVEVEEENGSTRVFGTVANEQDDDKTVAVAIRIGSGDNARYGWDELSIAPNQSDEFDIVLEELDSISEADVDAVAVDWHI